MKILNHYQYIIVYYDIFDRGGSFIDHRSMMFSDYKSCKNFILSLKSESEFVVFVRSVVRTTIEELLPYD